MSNNAPNMAACAGADPGGGFEGLKPPPSTYVLPRAYTEKRACNSPYSQNHPTSY